MAIVFGEYPRNVVEFVADPRTGTITEFPMGLPNVGQIKEFCDRVMQRRSILARPYRQPVPYIPPKLKEGRITYGQFLELAAAGKTKSRPIGLFEKGGYFG